MLDLSVIITTHNRPKLLLRAIESVVDLLRAVNSELIIVDDGDTLESGRVVSDISCSLGLNITYLKRNDKPGLGRSRNYGVTLSRAKNLIFLDDDDQILSDYYIALIKSYPNLEEVIYGDFTYVLEDRDSNKTINFKTINQNLKSTEQLEFQNFIPVASYIVPKMVFNEYNWDESIGTHEDYDFMLYTKRNFGMKYCAGQACKIYIDVHRKGQMTSASKVKQGLDNLQIYRKYHTADDNIINNRVSRLKMYGLNINDFYKNI